MMSPAKLRVQNRPRWLSDRLLIGAWQKTKETGWSLQSYCHTAFRQAIAKQNEGEATRFPTSAHLDHVILTQFGVDAPLSS
jgi:hypothetical protein